MREFLEALEDFRLRLEGLQEAEEAKDEDRWGYEYYQGYYAESEKRLRTVFRALLLELLSELVVGKNPAAALAILSQPPAAPPAAAEPDNGPVRATLRLVGSSNRLKLP